VPEGFVLQPTYRIVRGRPVVLIWGVLDDGAPFLVRDDRSRPRFWIRSADLERARRLGVRAQAGAPAAESLAGVPVVPVEVAVPPDVPPLRRRLSRAGIPTFEADVRFAVRYLVERGIRGAMRIDGESGMEGDVRVFDNPDVTPASFTPELSVLSLDIETDPTASRLLSAALVGAGRDDVLLLTPEGADRPERAVACATEAELLRGIVERVRATDPDVLTGWNVVDFDLAVLARLAEKHDVPFLLGRNDEPVRLRASNAPGAGQEATIAGRVVLDGIQLVRGAFLRYPSYALDAVAREVLGQGKTMTGPGRAEEILDAFHRDRAGLTEYNRNDARLVLEILRELKLVELSVERSLLTGMAPNRVAASIASFDFLYLTELGRRGLVAPSVEDASAPMPQSGGHVLEPDAGLWENVLVLDFRSLYPSVIRTFQIDPLGHARASGDEDPIVAPNGARFRREPGILPQVLDELFPRREAAIAAGDRVASQAIKILMNSFYGVLGTSACRFASPELANAITGFGREILLGTKARIEARGLRVLYGDTDSLFVLSGVDDPARAQALGEGLVEDLNRELADWIDATWRVPSRLSLQFERLYRRLFLSSVRTGQGGARKRYAGLVEENGQSRVIFTGMEIVRRDWTELAKRVQREMYERLFSDRPVDDYLCGVVQDVRAGRLDGLLVYRKGLRRKLETYTASTPPHVAAARKMSGKPGSVIEYVMTTEGPEPADERESPIDREHYVQKQVRAVAEPVLEALGLTFDAAVGDDNQLELF
jgi:DNA polymerase-2